MLCRVDGRKEGKEGGWVPLYRRILAWVVSRINQGVTVLLGARPKQPFFLIHFFLRCNARFPFTFPALIFGGKLAPICNANAGGWLAKPCASVVYPSISRPCGWNGALAAHHQHAHTGIRPAKDVGSRFLPWIRGR